MCGYRTTIYLPRSHLRQKVGSYDYTDTKPTERTRPPQPLAKQKIQINGMTLERGVCGGIINSSLAVESISLDHDSYDMGDEFSYVLVLRAVYPTRVPIRASLAEIEPKDPKMTILRPRFAQSLAQNDCGRTPKPSGLEGSTGDRDRAEKRRVDRIAGRSENGVEQSVRRHANARR
jgi:hypothetical protein